MKDEVNVVVDASSLEAVPLNEEIMFNPLLYTIGPIRLCIASLSNCMAENVSSRFIGEEGDDGNMESKCVRSSILC